MSLTGRTRHRVGGFFKKRLILQVEYNYTWWAPYPDVDSQTKQAWRDATVEDISVIENKQEIQEQQECK